MVASSLPAFLLHVITFLLNCYRLFESCNRKNAETSKYCHKGIKVANVETFLRHLYPILAHSAAGFLLGHLQKKCIESANIVAKRSMYYLIFHELDKKWEKHKNCMELCIGKRMVTFHVPNCVAFRKRKNLLWSPFY